MGEGKGQKNLFDLFILLFNSHLKHFTLYLFRLHKVLSHIH